LILLTGASGYIGGRLLDRLASSGHRVRCMARRPEHLAHRTQPHTEVLQGDVLAPDGLARALAGIDVAYYLVHSMGSSGSFELEDRRGAENFACAARIAAVRRIIYVGGLGDSSQPLSPHLRSRHQVGEILRGSGVQTIEFRASLVIGSGSLSFEMVRALVERLPIMITPRWVSNRAQPIAIDDLLAYLLAALTVQVAGSPVVEIGGRDTVSYADIMVEYARQRGLRRLMIPLPVLTPWLSSLWLGLVTPLFARVGRKLIDSIYHPTVVCDSRAARAFNVHPVGIGAAIASALRGEDRAFASTRWTDPLSAAGTPSDWSGVRFGNRLVDSRTIQVPVSPERAFAPIGRIGGGAGWYFADWLWRLRGFLDLLVGGVGMRRGRRDPEALRVGDVLDCWRVEIIEPPHRLRLIGEMKLPGRAWLDFEVTGDTDCSTIRQTAVYDPIGLTGLAYWYAVYPLHQIVFRGMLREIALRAVAWDGTSTRTTKEHVLQDSS
jgi:uncharacterized protein YbjT (DUF2867 family)